VRFLSRIAAALNAAWDPQISARCQAASRDALRALNAVLKTTFVSTGDAIRGDVLDVVVRRLWQLEEPPTACVSADVAARDSNELSDQWTDEIDCIEVVKTAARHRTSDIRARLHALGATDAIARRPLRRLHLDALYQLTLPRGRRLADVSVAVVRSLGRCLSNDSNLWDEAAEVLCNVVSGNDGSVHVEALFDVPGVFECLFVVDAGSTDGTPRLPPTTHTVRLAMNCCQGSAALTEKAVAAGLLRPTSLQRLLDASAGYHSVALALTTFRDILVGRPPWASEAIRSGLPPRLRRALGCLRLPDVQIAAAQCLETAVRECDEQSAVAACFAAGVVSALSIALCGPDLNRRRAVVAALCALAARDRTTFAHEVATSAPRLKDTLGHLQRALPDAAAAAAAASAAPHHAGASMSKNFAGARSDFPEADNRMQRELAFLLHDVLGE